MKGTMNFKATIQAYLEEREKVGLPAEFSIFEVEQRWISPDGISTTVARKRGLAFVYYDLWIPESRMEIRTNQGHYVYDISPACYYPKQRFTKEVIRNGFDGWNNQDKAFLTSCFSRI